MKSKTPFYKIVIVLIAIAILGYVIYDFINKMQQRAKLKEGMLSNEPFYKEVFAEIAQKEIDSKEMPSGISDMAKKSQNMELMQYCIKGSANSAYSGQYISDEMVKYVLSRGCRFIDFEVYYLPVSDTPDNSDYAAYVGYSSDPAAVNSTSKNNYLFRKIFKSALANAFTRQSGDKYECPNPNDPLFVHIRMKTSDDMKNKLYDMIQSDIQTTYNSGYSDYFLTKLNKTTNIRESNKVNGSMPIRKLAKKVVIIFDYEPEEYIGSYHNMTSDTSQLMKYTYSELDTFKYKAMPPKRLDSNLTTVDKFKMAVPDSNRSSQPNPNIYMAIKDYGMQITLFQYYNTDLQLIRAESIFQYYTAGIVSLSLMLNYIKTNASDERAVNAPNLF
jgi:hypothetical protein